MDLTVSRRLDLPGGFRLIEVRLAHETMTDALGRVAVAETLITGDELRITLATRLSDEEMSISLYHEVLEAATVAASAPPPALASYNEADFERAARAAHGMFGQASPVNLARLLRRHGFGRTAKQ